MLNVSIRGLLKDGFHVPLARAQPPGLGFSFRIFTQQIMQPRMNKEPHLQESSLGAKQAQWLIESSICVARTPLHTIGRNRAIGHIASSRLGPSCPNSCHRRPRQTWVTLRPAHANARLPGLLLLYDAWVVSCVGCAVLSESHVVFCFSCLRLALATLTPEERRNLLQALHITFGERLRPSWSAEALQEVANYEGHTDPALENRIAALSQGP